MPIPVIHVGCGKFSLQRLQILIDGSQFTPVACVDINLEKARSDLASLKGNVPEGLIDRVYTTITEAKEKHDAEVCIIFVSSKVHAKLVVESLDLGMHTFCVKTIACDQEGFKSIMNVHNANPELMLVQGFNNQWNEAAEKMRELIQDKENFGKLLGGECLSWGRQNGKSDPPEPETVIEGMFFHTLACHQLSQVVAALGLPESVTAYVHQRSDPAIGYIGVFGTSGGQAIFEFADNVPFSYTGTRVGHGNPFGFASRWSGRWIMHGEKGDIIREGGRVTLYRDGGPKEDYYLKDIDADLLEDDRIQFNAFYNAITTGKDREWLQQSSLDTWILMEACNESARRNEKININEFKKYLTEE